MRKFLLTASVVSASLLGPAWAQTTVIEISPEQERNVYTIITRERVRTPPPPDMRFSVGAVLPESVEMYDLPPAIEVPAVRPYRYTVWDDRVVLIDPGTRRVIRIIER